MYTQAELIKKYNDMSREHFNPELFERSDDKLIESLEIAILSCQRDQAFSIKVTNFTVIKEYALIMQIMKFYEQTHGSNRRRRKVNQYDFIDLKDSDVMLLVVTYEIGVKDEKKSMVSYILVPIVVEKYYYKIFGNLYSTYYQIVDGSVYNNSLKNNKKYPAVIMKTLSQPVYVKKVKQEVTSTSGEPLEINNFKALIFKKEFSIMKYFIAKYGIYYVLDFLHLKHIVYTNVASNDELLYSFKVGNFFVTVPKVLYLNDAITQSYIYTLITEIEPNLSLSDISVQSYWLKKLGKEFGSAIEEKGKSILNSLEAVRDINTVKELRMPLEYKYNIYCILRWIIREFDILKVRDGLDLAYKRIRLEEVIASLYTTKLNKSIYMLSDLGNKVTLDKVEKFLRQRPTYLLESITKCNLANYRNLVNDLDGITALKFTFKGEGGITTPQIQYRHVHPSNIGRIDPDSSTKSDPGMSGIICPLTETYDGYFSNFSEPNTWGKTYDALISEYESQTNKKQIVNCKKELFGYDEVVDSYYSDMELLKKKERKILIRKLNDNEDPESILKEKGINENIIDRGDSYVS